MFFSRLNADRDRERRTIGLSAERGAAFHITSGAVLAAILAALLILGVWRVNTIARDLRVLSEAVDAVQGKTGEIDENFRRFLQESGKTSENQDDAAPDFNFNSILYLDKSHAFIRMDDGTFYLGPVENGSPSGIGLLLENGAYYFGAFHDGVRDGAFLIFSEEDFPETRTEIFAPDSDLDLDFNADGGTDGKMADETDGESVGD